MVNKDLGMVTAYAYAVSKGYTGTEEEFAELMADYAAVGQRAEQAATAAAASATAAAESATASATIGDELALLKDKETVLHGVSVSSEHNYKNAVGDAVLLVWEVGGISGTTGEDVDNPNRVRTQYVPVKSGMTYYIYYSGFDSSNYVLYILFYDSNKEFIRLSSPSSNGYGEFSTGDDIAFIRVAITSNSGSVSLAYAEALNISVYINNGRTFNRISDAHRYNAKTMRNYIADVPFDTYGWEPGQLSGNDGKTIANFETNVRTDYFEVIPGETYHFSHVGDLTGYTFWVYAYDENKEYTRYLAPLVTSDLHVNDDEKYWRLRLNKGSTPITPEIAESFQIRFIGSPGTLSVDVDDNSEAIHDFIFSDKIDDIVWESGGINGLTGADTVNANRSRTGFYHVAPTVDYSLVHNQFDGHVLYAVYYTGSTTNTFYGVENISDMDVFSIPSGVNYLRLAIQKENATVNPETATQFDIHIYKSDGIVFDEFNKINGYLIEQPDIQVLPSSLVSMPDVGYSSSIPNVTGVSVAKSAIYKNGNHFCVIYGENIDGTANDFPEYSESGCLEMSYKLFDLVGDVESNSSFGVLAKKGDTYIDRNGVSKTMPGGCGLPSGVNNLQYFTVPYERSDNDPSYTAYGYTNYGMIPCVSEVTLANDGTVTFSTPHELILVVDGTSGEFNMRRIDPKYKTSLSYITTTPPFYDGTKYHWLQIITKGFVYLQSNDGITWNYIAKAVTPFQTMREIVCVIKGDYLYFAARVPSRTMGADKIASDFLCIGRNHVSSPGTIRFMYKLPFIESRPNLTVSGSDILLFYTPASKKITKCLRIVEGQYNTEIFFWEWFTIYKNCTWYMTCYAPSVNNSNFTDMYLCGGSNEGPTTGVNSPLTFLHLKFSNTLPMNPNSIPFAVGGNADFDRNNKSKAELLTITSDIAREVSITFPITPTSVFIFGRATTDATHLIVADVVTLTTTQAPIQHLGTNSSITATRIDGYNIKLQLPAYSFVNIIAPAGTKMQ